MVKNSLQILQFTSSWRLTFDNYPSRIHTVLLSVNLPIFVTREKEGVVQKLRIATFIFAISTTYEGVSALGKDGHRQQTQTDAITL